MSDGKVCMADKNGCSRALFIPFSNHNVYRAHKYKTAKWRYTPVQVIRHWNTIRRIVTSFADLVKLSARISVHASVVEATWHPIPAR